MYDDLLTLDEAAAAYDVSPLTLRRAQYGEIEGAVKIRGRRGPEWRVAAASVEALGYRRAEAADLSSADILVVVRRLTETLSEALKENARLNRELGGAVAEAARLRAETEALRPPATVDLRTVVPRVSTS